MRPLGSSADQIGLDVPPSCRNPGAAVASGMVGEAQGVAPAKGQGPGPATQSREVLNMKDGYLSVQR